MTTLALGYRTIQKKLTNAGALKVPWKGLLFLGAAVALALLVLYVAFVNQLTGGAYLIKNYNKEVNLLLQEYSALEAHFQEAGFLGGVQDNAKMLGFEKTGEITYVQILNNSLAKK